MTNNKNEELDYVLSSLKSKFNCKIYSHNTDKRNITEIIWMKCLKPLQQSFAHHCNWEHLVNGYWSIYGLMTFSSKQ